MANRLQSSAGARWARERSLVDELVEGGFAYLPDDVQADLRAITNHRFFPTVEAQWAAAADLLRRYRDGP
jgi:hypothetical protein